MTAIQINANTLFETVQLLSFDIETPGPNNNVIIIN